MSQGRMPYRHGNTPDPYNVGSDYDDEELEFLIACDRYRIEHDLKFLAMTDVLCVVRQLGYIRLKREPNMAEQVVCILLMTAIMLASAAFLGWVFG